MLPNDLKVFQNSLSMPSDLPLSSAVKKSILTVAFEMSVNPSCYGEVILPTKIANKIAKKIFQFEPTNAEPFKFLKNVSELKISKKDVRSVKGNIIEEVFRQYAEKLQVVELHEILAYSHIKVPPLPALKKLYIPRSLTNEQVQAILLAARKENGMVKLESVTLESLEHLELVRQFCDIDNLSLDLSNRKGIDNRILQKISEDHGHHLIKLDISHCQSVTAFDGCHFPRLEALNAEGTNLGNSGLQALSRTSQKLRVLNVSGCSGITFEGCEFPALEELNASGTNLTSAGMQQLICSAPHMKKWNCASGIASNMNRQPSYYGELTLPARFANEIADWIVRFGSQTPEPFQFLKNVTELKISNIHSSMLQADVVQEFLTQYADQLEVVELHPFLRNFSINVPPLPALKKLYIPKALTCEQVRDILQAARGENGRVKLESLSLESLEHLELVSQICDVDNLRLDLSRCKEVDNATLTKISEDYGHALTKLDISYCQSVTAFDGCHFPRLEVLNAERTRLGNQGLQDLSRTSLKLRSLNVSGCSGITFEGCEFPTLEELNASSTKLSSAGLLQLGRFAPQLTTLNMDSVYTGAFSQLDDQPVVFLNLKTLVATASYSGYGCASFARVFPELESLTLDSSLRKLYSTISKDYRIQRSWEPRIVFVDDGEEE